MSVKRRGVEQRLRRGRNMPSPSVRQCFTSFIVLSSRAKRVFAMMWSKRALSHAESLKGSVAPQRKSRPGHTSAHHDRGATRPLLLLQKEHSAHAVQHHVHRKRHYDELVDGDILVFPHPAPLSVIDRRTPYICTSIRPFSQASKMMILPIYTRKLVTKEAEDIRLQDVGATRSAVSLVFP